ncbi:MAG: hypothetical protein AABX08_01855 [Nanoarchaeota archaeon]
MSRQKQNRENMIAIDPVNICDIDELGSLLEKLVKQDARSSVAPEKYPVSGTPAERFDYIKRMTKYIAFDCEAAKRENKYLRQLLEEQ